MFSLIFVLSLVHALAGLSNADSSGCIRRGSIRAINDALRQIIGAPGSVAVLPFSVDESEARGNLSVRVPDSFTHNECGYYGKFLRYHFTISDIVGTIGRSGSLWNRQHRQCFKGAATLPIGPGRVEKLTLDVKMETGSPRISTAPHKDFWTELLQVGPWSSWQDADNCSFLYTSTVIDLENAFAGWLDEIKRRLNSLASSSQSTSEED